MERILDKNLSKVRINVLFILKNFYIIGGKYYGFYNWDITCVMLTVRCIGKPCSVFLRICWKTLRVVIPKQRDEICSNGNGLKSLQIGQSAGKIRIISPSTTRAEMLVGQVPEVKDT